MSVLDRSALTESPLADLHAIASELSIDGYRRLRRPELIDAILAKQGGTEVEPAAGEEVPDEETAAEKAPASPRSRSRRPRKSEAAETTDTDTTDAETTASADDAEEPEKAEEAEKAEKAEKADDASDDDEGTGAPRRRGRRGGRGRGSAAKAEPEAGSDSDQADEDKPTRGSRRTRAAAEPAAEAVADDRGTPEESEQLVEGVVELLANGSGFVRVDPPDPSDDDVYISSAQVKRCELVSGDRIAGPKRAPRRSERFASLIRIETINDRPASELADSLRFDDLPAARPSERIKVGSEDPTLKAIEWLTPFGKGSRVAIVGASRSGKSEALRHLAAALAGRDELTLSVALAGVRPEEISEWAQGPVVPAAAVSFAASEESQNSAIEPVIDQARRLAARGADAVVLIDTLDGASPQMARKAMASARNIVDGGSVTVIATASEPIGGETTVISLDVALASIGRFPALDLVASGTLRPELLVGEAGAEAIARTRAEVSDGDDE